MWLLEPLPVPKCPRSHMAVDFITYLPDSKGFNTILDAVDRFSKACCLISLKGLHTAMTTATTLFDYDYPSANLTLDLSAHSPLPAKLIRSLTGYKYHHHITSHISSMSSCINLHTHAKGPPQSVASLHHVWR